jgi:hypothetical protein
MTHTLEPLALPEGYQDLQGHPIANCWPEIKGEEYQELCQSVQDNGLLTPIVLYLGTILDGRNRFKACIFTKTVPTFMEYTGDAPEAYAISCNNARRHLSTSQRAMIASSLANLSVGKPNLTAQKKAVSQPDAAKALKVSRSAVQSAVTVNDRAVPELRNAVISGDVPVSLAAKVSQGTEEQQHAFVEAVEQGKKPSWAAREALAFGVQDAIELLKALPLEEIEGVLKRLKTEVMSAWKDAGWVPPKTRG